MKISTLADCFSVVSKSGTQIDALNSLLVEQTINSLAKHNNLVCLDEIDEEYINDDSGWVCIGSIKSIPLKTKGKRKPQRFINFQISLAGDYIGYPKNNNPLVYISLWECRASFSNEVYMSLPLTSLNSFEVHGNKIVLWKTQEDESWLQHEWTFAVHLEKINSISDMNENVIQPLIKLVTGTCIDDALPDTLPALALHWMNLQAHTSTD